MIKRIKSAVRRSLIGRDEAKESNPFLEFAPPGHFYSPLPAIDEVRASVAQNGDITGTFAPIPEVALNESAQLELLKAFGAYYGEMPFGEKPGSKTRYYFGQDYYCYSDAIYLYGMLRHFKPGRLVEVGSGHSSALILDTAELFLNNQLQCTFIKPYPDRLNLLLRPSDSQSVRVIVKKVQEVDPKPFGELRTNDILFIDSSHVSKFGSDVNYLLFRILPSLASGVVIHIHDIFYPFEYPIDWLLQGRAWNESYLVRAFLQNNNAYEVLLMSHFAGLRFKETLEKLMPLCLQNTGSSLWLRKK